MENFSAQKEVKALGGLCSRLNKPLYIVGGFVRNILGGLVCKNGSEGDIDICSDFDGQEFFSVGAKVTPINKRMGTSKIEYGGFSYEYTRFRRESYNEGGGHTPYEVDFVPDLSLDALRRDFTINSVYYDTVNDKIIDPLNGADDIKNKIIRCFDAEKVFSSDGLRLLRLCRFAAETGYKIEQKTLRAAKKFRSNLADIAKERKRDELEKILRADTKYGVKDAHYRGLKLLTRLELWDFVCQHISELKGVAQNPKYHKYDVFEHTLKTVKYAPPQLRLAALLHDIGKPVCQKKDGNMYDHAEEGAKIAASAMAGLAYPIKEIERVKKLIGLHMFDLNQTARDGKMRLFAAENFDLLDDLQALVVADGKATGQKQLYKPRFLEFKERLIKENAPVRLNDLKIDGADCVAAGLKGGKIGAALNDLWRECILNPPLNNREWLLSRLTNIAAT